MFTEKELHFLRSQRLGRLATVGADGRPHNVPVGVHYNAELAVFDIVGLDLGKSRKYRDVLGNPLVSFVVDDVAETDPWTPRGIEIRGRAVALTEGGRKYGDLVAEEIIRIVPDRLISWGIERNWSAGPFARNVENKERK
jgi:PPOX class F420-dependent enzyme/OxyR family protein